MSKVIGIFCDVSTIDRSDSIVLSLMNQTYDLVRVVLINNTVDWELQKYIDFTSMPELSDKFWVASYFTGNSSLTLEEIDLYKREYIIPEMLSDCDIIIDWDPVMLYDDKYLENLANA